MFALSEDATEEDKKEALKTYLQSKYPDRLKQEADLSKPADIVSSQPKTNTMASEYERLAADDAEVKAALEQQDRAKKASMFGDALSSLVTARGAASGYKRDGSFFDRVGTMNDSQVADARANRQQKIDNFLKKDQINYQENERARQNVIRGREDSEYNRSQMMRQQEDDLTSDVSKNYQQLASKMVGGKRDFGNMSATQLKQVMPNLEKLYSIDENNRTRRETQNQRAFEQSLRRDDKRVALEDKQKERDDKKKTLLNEVEDRRQNIEDNLSLLESMIDDKGTYEMLGSHNQDLDRRVEMIATDMAKLADPSSVARPGEVEAFKKGLIQSGVWKNTNSTAKDILKNFRNEINQRVDNAYKIRGLENPGSQSQKASSNKAKTIIQNGHTYTLNEKTGEYE